MRGVSDEIEFASFVCESEVAFPSGAKIDVALVDAPHRDREERGRGHRPTAFDQVRVDS